MAENKLEKILQSADYRVKGQPLTVKVDADQQRRAWYATFCATGRTLLEEVPDIHKDLLNVEPRELAVIHHGCRARVYIIEGNGIGGMEQCSSCESWHHQGSCGEAHAAVGVKARQAGRQAHLF